MAKAFDEQLNDRFGEYCETLRKQPVPGTGYFYALVDTTQHPNLAIELEARSKMVRPLSLSGIDGPTLAEIGELEPVHTWLIEEGRGKSWNIFLFSPEPFESMWNHLRKFTTIVTHHGDEMGFRFYDPLVLNQYLPAFSKEQRSAFFSRIDDVIAELGPYYMSYRFDEKSGKLNWTLLYIEPVDDTTEGIISPPNIDLTGSRVSPLFHFSKQQYEMPVIINMPLLIKDVDAYLREDFAVRMSCYAPGLLRAMIQAAMTTAIREYGLLDLEVLRQFAEMQWRIAPGFHKQPEINQLLSDTSKTPAERWDALLSESYDDALVQAFDYDKTEDWGLPLPVSEEET